MTKQNPLRSPVFLLALVLVAPFLWILVAPGGRVLGHPQGDNPAMFFYYNDFAGRCWRDGVLPLWNPYLMLGHPFLGEGQAALFHPLSWLFIALPAGVAINWISALCFVMGGLFFYGWMRALGLSRAAAACGSLLWSFSNIMISRIYAGHLTNTLIFFELPLLFMAWERYRQTRRVAWLVGLGLTYATMILAAHPQFLYIFSLFFMVYVLGQSVPDMWARNGARGQGRMILALGVAVVLAIGIGAVQLLPTADLARQSFRTQVSYEFSTWSSFPPENLFTAIAPRVFGYTREDGPLQYWGKESVWEVWVYIGILPLLMVPLGILTAPRRRRYTLLACMAGFTAIALGEYTPLFRWIYEYLPFIKMFRGPAKNMMITELCLIVFAAHGIERVLRPRGDAAERRGLIAALAGGAVLLGVVAAAYAYFIPGSGEAGSHFYRLIAYVRQGLTLVEVPPEIARQLAGWSGRELGRAALFIVLGLGLVGLAWSGRWRRALLPLMLVLIMADLLWTFGPLLFKSYDVALASLPKELVKPLEGSPYPLRAVGPIFGTDRVNVAMHHRFSTPSGYVGNTLLRYNTFVNACQGIPNVLPQLGDPINAYFPVLRFCALDALFLPAREVAPGMPVLARTAEAALVRAPEPFPRVFLAAAPRAVNNPEGALAHVITPGADLLQSPAVELAGPPEAAALEAGEGARISAYRINRVEVEARAARGRVLVLCEMFEKNWRATVNGARAEIFPANYLFRGVRMPAGESRVVFEYRPAALAWGAGIALLSLAGLAGLGVWGRGRRWPEEK